jgi:hypothetical protein
MALSQQVMPHQMVNWFLLILLFVVVARGGGRIISPFGGM